ncbi:MAG: VCBS repeat-containing protein [Acidobacteriota bacterium]
MQRFIPLLAIVVLIALFAAAIEWPVSAADCTRTSIGQTPLTDLGTGSYLGFTGGLYSGGSNSIPSDHLAAGLARSAQVQPLDTNGNPSPNGKYVLLSVGMSNTSNEFCAAGTTTNCTPETFIPRAAADQQVNHSRLAIVNGAQGGQDAQAWTSPTSPTYNAVRDQRLAAFQLTEAQVQAVWLKQANAGPTSSLPNSNADAYDLLTKLGMIIRAMKTRYPNLKQVFLSNRIYAGYATATLNPEPYAYESGFAVKWLIEAQIDQMRGLPQDPRAGNLSYDTVAPWIGWGPDLWANGTTPRSDNLSYLCSDLNSDGTHPSAGGRAKVASLLLNFFKSNPISRRWFLASPDASVDFDGDGKTDIGIFRPVGAASEWWINRSSTGVTFALQFGASTDRITPADYTGDGKTDIAFFRPASGEWYVLRSEDFSFFALPFGANGDIPVPADYDADGKADFAVMRPSTSTWYISQSSGAPTRIEQFGSAGDVPVVSDYDGDGKADVAIFRNAGGVAQWWINRSTAGLLALQFGASTDKAVQGDYTGDGKADVAIWRPSTGEWFIVRSEDFSFYGFPFGANGDVIAPGDYDGDGKFDPTVFRPSSATWFIARTTAGTQIVQFGANGDRPLPNAFVP